MKIEILKWRTFEKNSLQGFVDICIGDIGLEIGGCTFHRKGDARWIGLPARQYQDHNGLRQWARTLYFFDKERHQDFQAATVAALEDYLRATPAQAADPVATEQPAEADLPF